MENLKSFLKINSMYKYIKFRELERSEKYVVNKICTVDNDNKLKVLVLLDNMCCFILPPGYIDIFIQFYDAINIPYAETTFSLIYQQLPSNHNFFYASVPNFYEELPNQYNRFYEDLQNLGNLEISYDLFCNFVLEFLVHYPRYEQFYNNDYTSDYSDIDSGGDSDIDSDNLVRVNDMFV